MSLPCASTHASANCAGLQFFSLAISCNPAHEIQILLEIFSLKARRIAAVVVRRKIFEALELSRKKSAAKGTVSHETDAKFAARGQNLRFPDRGSRASIRFAGPRSDELSRRGAAFAGSASESPI